MWRSSFFLAVVLMFAQASHAQRSPLEADRPDQTESPAIVPAGWFQLEAGCSRERSRVDGVTALCHSLPAMLAKMGLGRRVELRVVVEHSAEQAGEKALFRSGLLPIEAGGKVALFEERGIRPRTSLIAHAGLPFTAHEAFRPRTGYGTFRFTMQHTLTDVLSLGYNLGAEWNGDSPTADGVYTLTLGAQFTRVLGLFVEGYGAVNGRAPADHRLDGGATCRLGPDVLLDASGGFSLSAQCWFIGAGFSFRAPVFAARSPATP